MLPFLRSERAAVSMGLIDLSPARARVVRRLEAEGVPVTAWLLLDVADGYWLNADNVDRAVSRWHETATWADREGLRLPRVGLDVEFPRSESEGAIRDRRRAFFHMMRRRRTRKEVALAEHEYAALVAEIHAGGRAVEAYHFPQLLDERAAGSTLLRRSLGLVDVPVDAEVYMLYSSYLGRAGVRAYFDDAPCIALGVTGGGVNVDNPDARRRFLSFERLREDLLAAAAHTREVYVFSLEGCVGAGMLEAIAAIDWGAPIPRVTAREARGARRSRLFTRLTLRAEPIIDLLLPSRRSPLPAAPPGAAARPRRPPG